MMTRESSEKAKRAERVGWRLKLLRPMPKMEGVRAVSCTDAAVSRGLLAQHGPEHHPRALYRRFPELNPDCEARSSMRECTPTRAVRRRVRTCAFGWPCVIAGTDPGSLGVIR